MNSAFHFRFGNIEYALASRTHIMGILNVTPDSFSDGGKYFTHEEAGDRGKKMADEGADFIDVGGESTRPGSEPVAVDEEIRRIVPVIEILVRNVQIPISVDTSKAEVAAAALNAGAVIINDISAMTCDDKMPAVAVHHQASVILMHMKGTPQTMQNNPAYRNVNKEIKKHLSERVRAARRAGIVQCIIDPGIGFGKTFDHNIEIIRDLHEYASIGCPLLVGPSRKAFLGAILQTPAHERIEGTAAAVTACILQGAHIVRVHDVQQMKRVALVADALKKV